MLWSGRWCPVTHNEGTSRAEGKGAAGVQVGGIERDQDTNKVEALCLGRQRIRVSGHLPHTLGPYGLPPTLPGGERAQNCWGGVSLDIFTERDAGDHLGKQPPPLPAQPDAIQ